MTIKETLLAVSAYPIPCRTIEASALKRGVSLDAEADTETLNSPSYLLVKADLYMWLFATPNVAQGGQSYSFGDRNQYLRMAMAIFNKYGNEEDVALSGTRYGYMGDRL